MSREQLWSSWMQAANAGDSAAYERFLTDVATAFRPIILRRLGQTRAAEAEDVVQDLLLAVHLKGHTWDSSRPILPWIHAIARHKAQDSIRRLGRQKQAICDIDFSELEDQIAAPVVEAAPIGDLMRLMGQLPDRQRGVVRALALEGRSVAAVARQAGIGESAVRVAFHRGLETLRRLAG